MPFPLPEGRPALMGILNVTPDSFSDGGRFSRPDEAIRFAIKMMDEGADLIDVGGESTRPGAAEVSLDEELRRILPVILALVERGIPVSVDTSKAAVARVALEAGAKVVNDVTGFRDPEMIEACANVDCTVCIMHMQGTPRTMQQNPVYGDVVQEVLDTLSCRIDECETSGIAMNRIWIDPGIGFGKTVDQNLELLRHLDRFTLTDYPVLIGVSRKSFVGVINGVDNPSDRLEGTLAAQVLAQLKGVKIIRTHDVLAARRAIDMTSKILHG